LIDKEQEAEKTKRSRGKAEDVGNEMMMLFKKGPDHQRYLPGVSILVA
jgi:hypothetical protein